MHSGMIGVWDKDRTYAAKLSEYMRRQGGLGSFVVLFSEWDRLRKAMEQDQMAVVVIGGMEKKELQKLLEEVDYGMAGFSVVYLSETKSGKDTAQSREIWAAETMDSSSQKAVGGAVEEGVLPQIIEVYKYQSAGAVVKAVAGARARMAVGGNCGEMPARLRGIYSPAGGCMKTSLGLAMGNMLAENGRCLFLCLEAHSGFRCLFGRKYDLDLADLMAALRVRSGQEDPAFMVLLNEALQSLGKLYYIPPVIWPSDIRESEENELRALLRSLALCGQFDEIVIDVGNDLARPEAVLSWCDHIYRPEKEDVFFQAKLTEYREYLKSSGYEALEKRTRSVMLPRTGEGQGASLEQWMRWEHWIPVVHHLLETENQNTQDR